MKIPIILAHGALGAFDELIMMGVAIAFFVMMGVSWIKSRSMKGIFDEDEKPQGDEQDTQTNSVDTDRFPLE